MKGTVNHQINLAEEKLGAAKHLFGGGYYRDAISRAYYCMYHAAKAILALKDLYPKTHRGVLREFGLEIIKKSEVEEYYGKALRFVMDKREKSDYDVFAQVSKEETEAIIQDAEKFLGKIKEVIKETKKEE